MELIKLKEARGFLYERESIRGASRKRKIVGRRAAVYLLLYLEGGSQRDAFDASTFLEKLHSRSEYRL